MSSVASGLSQQRAEIQTLNVLRQQKSKVMGATFATDPKKWERAAKGYGLLLSPRFLSVLPFGRSADQFTETWKGPHADALVVGTVIMDLINPGAYDMLGPITVYTRCRIRVVSGGKMVSDLSKTGRLAFRDPAPSTPEYYASYWRRLFKYIKSEQWYDKDDNICFLLDHMFPFLDPAHDTSFEHFVQEFLQS